MNNSLTLRFLIERIKEVMNICEILVRITKIYSE